MEIEKIAGMEYNYLSFFLILFTILLFLVLFMPVRLITWKKPKNHNPRQKLPPGPPKLPLLGNLHLFMGTLPHHCLRDLANKHGPLMHLQLGELSIVVISSPEAAQQVMQTHDVNFANRPYSFAASLILYKYTDIAFAPYGDHWRQLRKICMLQLLSTRRVQSFRAVREEEVADFIRQISSKAGSPINLRKRLWSLTYGIISRVAFGVKYKDQDDLAIVVQELSDLAGGFSIGEVFPTMKLFYAISGATSKLKKIHQKTDSFLQNIIEEHRGRARKATRKEEVNDLVHVLLKFQDCADLGIPITDSTIKAVIMDIFGAGGETASTTIEWAMSEMLKNPRVLKKAQIELVIKETLRLHPPAPLLIPRENRESCEINGYDIPAKTRVIVNAWAIGRDPNYWTDSEKFYPERFLDSSVDFKGVNFEFIPFGAGRRICPGMSLGIANIELPLAQLLYHFDWKFDDGRKLEDIDMTEVSV
ncbi:hypothetical protein PTKIN_Ptkin14bG0083800 [Pterospermum kingtungense]